MTDLKQNIQEAFDELEDFDESWALKLLDECENDFQVKANDEQAIYLENETTTLLFQKEETNNLNDKQPEKLVSPSAIELQMRQSVRQSKPESVKNELAPKRFWSFFKKTTSFN